MKFSDFERIVTGIYNLNIEREQYADRIPLDISSFVFDNEYQNKSDSMFKILFNEVFGKYSEDVEIFLYSSMPQKISVDLRDGMGERKYEINGLSDYLKYAKEVFDFDPE